MTFCRLLCHVRHSLVGLLAGAKRSQARNDPASAPSPRNMAEAENLAVKLESTLESVDMAEEMVKGFAEKSGFPEEEVHQIGMAVRESVINAVVHGNCYNAQKKVSLSVEATGDRLTITVQDEGAGFEVEDVPDPLADENLLRKSGRGLFLIRAFMDDLRLHRLSPEGMEVVMIKNSPYPPARRKVK